METALARVTATAVALPYEDRVELLSVLVKSIAKPVSHDSKKKIKIGLKCLTLIQDVWVDFGQTRILLNISGDCARIE